MAATKERIKNHQTIQVVTNAAESRTFRPKIKTRKLMQATKIVFPLEIQNDMLHFFLIKVVFDLWFSQKKSYYFGEFALLVRFMNRTTSGIVLSEFVLNGDPL